MPTPVDAPAALVIEDHAAMRKMMAGVLKRAGYSRVLECDSVTTALTVLTAEKPFLALIDLRLPDGTGEDIVRAVRQDADAASMALVVMTADTDLDLRARLLQAGADAFVIKSAGLPAIREALEYAATVAAARSSA